MIDRFRQEGHSLVVIHEDVTDTYDTPGIVSLLQMVTSGSSSLRGAAVIDKVVGKAAAALLLLGGVAEFHALVVSKGALALLSQSAVKVSYEELVDHIADRARTGWCPMEQACRDCLTAPECLEQIKETLKRMKK